MARSAWRGTARRGAARRGTTRQSEARPGEARQGETKRGEARRGEVRLDIAWRGAARRRIGRKARLPAHARPCLRLRAVVSYSCPPLSLAHSFARLRPCPRRAPRRRASVSLRAVLLPSHREAASKQEPIWISGDLFLHSLSLFLSLLFFSLYLFLSISLSIASFFF